MNSADNYNIVDNDVYVNIHILPWNTEMINLELSHGP